MSLKEERNGLEDVCNLQEPLGKELEKDDPDQKGTVSSDDYEYLIRSTDVSLKNYFTLMNKPLHHLVENETKDSLKNIPIVCSYADMEFKTSTLVHKEWIRLMSIPKMNWGYTRFDEYTKKILLNRLQTNVYSGCNSETLTLVSSMLSLYHVVITELTTSEDNILIFTPTYYRFLFTLNTEKRKVIEYQLETKSNENGLLNFFIDFEKLENLFQSNKIKMLVFINPQNPTGRIWKFEEMKKLANLIHKYNCLVFSDDIFLECVEDPKLDYTSFLKFEEIHQNLIWAGSFGKAFNCSGNSFSYAIVPNKEIKSKLDFTIQKVAIFPNMCSVKMLESCFTVGEEWRKNTIRYIKENHKIFYDEIKKRGLNLGLYTLESGFLAVIDFKEHKLTHSEIKTRLDSQNIFPTYFDNCYANREFESISIVRINLAMNKSLLMEFINRIEKALKEAK